MIGNRIKKKLKSNKGTSIFFGLLLFLVASILCTVMINASVTTVKRVESDKKAEQNYLTCSSAAKLLRDSIANIEIKKVTTVVENVSNNTIVSSNETAVWSAGTKDTEITASAENIKEFLKDYVESYDKRNPADTTAAKQKCTLSVSTNAADGIKVGMEDVTAEFEIISATEGGAYTIIIKLKVGEGIDSCQMAIKLDGSITVSNPINNREYNDWWSKRDYKSTTTTTTTYTWTVRDTVYGDQVRTSEVN